MIVFSPWVYSEGRPDTFSLQHLVNSPPFAGLKDEEFAIAVWGYLSSEELGVYHYCPVHDRFRDREVHDPLKIINCFGFAICHIHAHIQCQVFKAAGYDVRVACITGHEGSEIYYDGAWHYFDCDLRGFSRRHAPEQHIIASREDMYRDPTIVSEQQNPSTPYYVEDRPPQRMAELFKSEPAYLRPLDELNHSMDFALRPGESILRSFDHEGKYLMTSNYRSMWQRFWTEPGPGGPHERWAPHRTWGNGHWTYSPNLTDASRDLDAHGVVVNNLVRTGDGLEVPVGATGSLEIDFDIPYPVAGTPDETGVFPPRDGAMFKIHSQRSVRGDELRVLLSFDDGNSWEEVWFNHTPGKSATQLDLTPYLENRYRFRIRLELTGAGARRDPAGDGQLTEPRCALLGLDADLSFMVSPWTLPAVLPETATKMTYHAFDQNRKPTMKAVLDLEFAKPEVFKRHVIASENLQYDPESTEIFKAIDATEPWSATIRFDTPRAGGIVGAYISALWQGRLPDETVDHDFTIEAKDGESGEWIEVDRVEPDPHKLGWHFTKGAEASFSGDNGSVYFRLSGQKGILGTRISGRYIPDSISAEYSNPAFKIVHRWQEHRVMKEHVEIIEAGTLDHEYEIRGGKKVENLSVEIRMPSTSG